jgi:hypothetical protein
MDSFIQEIRGLFGKNEDFFLLQDYVSDAPVVLLGFKTLLDLTKTKAVLYKNIESMLSAGKSSEEVLINIGEVKEKDIKMATSTLLEGKLIILIENSKNYVVFEPVPKSLNRSVQSPENENVLQGALNSFTEDIDTNIGIMRRQLITNDLFVQSFTTGKNQKKKISLLYLENQADKDLVRKIVNRIETNLDMDINNIQELTKLMGFSSWEAISKFHTSELPFQAVHLLNKGRVVLFVDQLPFAFILPNFFWDLFAMENDRNFPKPIMFAIRAVRVIGVLITLISPGLYVALVAVNPEVLQIELALSIARSREGVPYPALVEIILMLLILELILEASVRLPKSIGPTITMVGGIILGQAAVEAKLVSNLLIIILAATTIANSTVVSFQNSVSIRVFKYVVVLLSAIFGILGLVAGLVLVCAYFASLNTFGFSYLNVNLKKDEMNG